MTGSTARTLVAAMAIASFSGACASTDLDQLTRAGGGDAKTVMLTVENQNWQDATVYLVNNGPRIRLGTVATNASERFVVPRAMRAQGTVRLAVDLIGSSESSTTGPIMLSPGADIHWTIQNQLALSSYSVQ